jgi:membrane protein implicated in regulation of membrane protease activity
VRRFARENGLALTFGALFLGSLIAQAIVGHALFNHDQAAHQGSTISLGRYLTSSSFAVDVMENWQSEYLQFSLFVLLTVWFVQKGSTESKQVGKEGLESDSDQMIGEHAKPDSPRWAKLGGWRTTLYSHSLGITMTLIWLGSWFAQAVTGRVDYNAAQLDHHEAALSLGQYIGSSDFWDRTLQNWQSEFLAVASFGVLSIFLRERGSGESKPVGAPHEATGLEG